MSTSLYTMTIREIMKMYNIFDFDYELNDDMFSKGSLERTFVDVYMFREICFETYEKWKPRFELRWRDMCNKYNKVLTKFNELTMEDIMLTGKTDNSGINTMSSMQEQTTKNIPTPVDSVPSDTDIPNSYGKVDGISDGTGSTQSTSKRQNKPTMEMLKQYLSTYEDPEHLMVKELSNLFLPIY